MPLITLAADGTGEIPERVYNGINANRKALVFQLISGTCQWAWDNSGNRTGSISASGATDSGFTMTVKQVFAYADSFCDCSRRIMLLGSASATIEWQENLSAS